MTFPSSYTTLTFASVTFVRHTEGNGFPPWFEPKTNYTRDEVLGGTLAYVDIGSDATPPLAFIGEFSSAADRTTMRAARKTTGTLTSSDGESSTVVLVEATRINGFGLHLLDLKFELVQ